ncbi:MAG: hypothetical protein R6X22_10020 [Gemmatimonadota bacterium]
MFSGPGTWIAGSALVAVAAAWLRYAAREEAVPGRAGPALLHAAALFLLLAGIRLPTLQGDRVPPPRKAALVDLSASMALPVRAGGGSRLDSALAVISGLEVDFALGFGDTVVSVALPGKERARPAGDRLELRGGARESRLAPALRAARTAGASSAVVITDGELEDREEARAEAARLGLGLEELRVAPPVPRTAIVEVRGPARVVAGDTVWIEVELRTPATASGAEDSVGVTASGPAGERAARRVPRPDPGRSVRLTLGLAAGPVGDEPEWRGYEIGLEPGADPLRPGATTRTWVEVAPAPRGAVLVSVDPDWEAGYLLPVLDRASAGGARGFLRLGGGWTSVGARPGPVTEPELRRAVAGADLLVLQGRPAELPPWLAEEAASARSLLLLVRGPGPVPGAAGGRIGAPLPGEWYPMTPVPSSPVAGYVAGLDPAPLPPVGALRELAGERGWSALELARDRRGDRLPLAVGLESDGSRRVVVLAEGTWRWAARTGRPREVYRALFSGLGGWLLESADREPVALGESPAGEQGFVALRVAEGVRDLAVSVRDSAGAEVARDSIPAPGPEARLRVGSEGDVWLVATGRVDGRPFRWGRPVRLPGPRAELAGRQGGPVLSVPGSGPRASAGPGVRWRGPPIWPFALAAVALCGEWAWRRRIGLR